MGGDGIYVAASNASANGTPKATIYPHTSSSANGNIHINDIVYFYTKDTINVAADISDDNRKVNNIDLYIDDSAVPVSEYTNVAPGDHTVYSVDRAGNKSQVRTFHVTGDTSGLEEYEGYVTFAMPAGGKIYRGNADIDSTKNYVISSDQDLYNAFVGIMYSRANLLYDGDIAPGHPVTPCGVRASQGDGAKSHAEPSHGASSANAAQAGSPHA